MAENDEPTQAERLSVSRFLGLAGRRSHERRIARLRAEVLHRWPDVSEQEMDRHVQLLLSAEMRGIARLPRRHRGEHRDSEPRS
ncbi:MAG: hypothetical protein ACRDJ2_10310 [Actinomycetota bacterium]